MYLFSTLVDWDISFRISYLGIYFLVITVQSKYKKIFKSMNI